MKEQREHWLIMTSDRIFTQNYYYGSYEGAREYASALYGKNHAIVKDNRNANHPFWARHRQP